MASTNLYKIKGGLQHSKAESTTARRGGGRAYYTVLSEEGERDVMVERPQLLNTLRKKKKKNVKQEER